ncbi:MAG TPA: SMP-30/gluconolactonase/LRE family protein [Bryobacteraceae bacterium]|nr:SMP-30/gluconolactonase/LRE family protein [Bryobacteraceae bacterium]
MKRALTVLCLTALTASAQNFDDIMSERVASGMQYVDGVVWSRDGFLIFSDVLKRIVYRLDPGVAPKPTDENHNGAQGLAYDAQGRLHICESVNRRVVRMDRKGRQEVIAESFQGKKFNSPNDIVVRKDGNVYFTDPAFGGTADTRELDYNGIYRIPPKGDVELVAKWTTRPNGIAISGDGKSLFVTDSDRRAVVAFELDSKGAAAGPHDVIRNIKGVPGGLRTDVNGHFYVGALGLGVYTREGKLIHTFMPTEVVTNCAFGDPDFETIYACGRKAVYKIRVAVKGAIQY